LFLGNVACPFEIVEGEDVLELGLVVDDGATALLFPLFQNIDEELLDVLRLLVAEDCAEVLLAN